jgi:hypothetical protein
MVDIREEDLIQQVEDTPPAVAAQSGEDDKKERVVTKTGGEKTTTKTTEGGEKTTTKQTSGGLSIEDIRAMFQPNREEAATRLKEEREAIGDLYDPEIKDLGSALEKAEKERERLNEKDEAARKRDKSYALISGIGDAMSGMANLYYTTKGAPSQTQGQALPEYMKGAEELRKERKLDMKTIEERRKELETQKRALQRSKGSDLKKATTEYEKEMNQIDTAEKAAMLKSGEADKITTTTVSTSPSSSTSTVKTDPSTTRTTGAGVGGNGGNGAGGGSKAERAIFTDKNGKKHELDLRDKENWVQEAMSFLTNLFENKDASVEDYLEDYQKAKTNNVVDKTSLDTFLKRFLYGPLVYEYLTEK